MNSLEHIDKLTRQTRRREFDDGLMDILNGGVFLLLGIANWFVFSAAGMSWLATAFIKRQEIAILALLAVVPALLLAIYGLRRLIARIRRAYLWKESGYVESLRWQVSKWINIIAVLGSVTLIAVAVRLMIGGSITEEQVLRAVATSVSLGTAIVYLGMGIDLRIRRYVVVGLAGLVLSAIVLAQAVSFSESWLMVGIGWMAILTVAGLWALRHSVLSLVDSSSD